MQIKGLRLLVVAGAVISTLAVLLAIQYFHQKYKVEEPLFKMYSQTKLVNKVDLEDKGNKIKVILHVNKTDNLKEAYQELSAQTEKVIGHPDFKMELVDTRTPVLESAFYESQFIIYEALAKGDFTKMADIIRQNAESAGAESRVFIDNENIYVEFMKGDNYLYEIVSRDQVRGEASTRMGSDQG